MMLQIQKIVSKQDADSSFRNLISESVVISPRKSSYETSPPHSLSPLKSPSKKDYPFLPQQQYVRLPISVNLLHSISQLKNESNRDLYLLYIFDAFFVVYC